MSTGTWIKHHQKVSIHEPIAVVGSPGLRSIGRLTIDYLLDAVQPKLIAELYSPHFPVVYQTKPSYASHPSLPGVGGITITSGHADLPKVQFYANKSPPLILTQGYHANFEGQYAVAQKVIDVFQEHRVKRVVVVAGYGMEGADICCAATNHQLIEEMREKYGVAVGYVGPFYGFSGVVFGSAKRRGLDAVCLFGRTEATPEDPERPDEQAAKTLVTKLAEMLQIPVNQ